MIWAPLNLYVKEYLMITRVEVSENSRLIDVIRQGAHAYGHDFLDCEEHSWEELPLKLYDSETEVTVLINCDSLDETNSHVKSLMIGMSDAEKEFILVYNI
jgi:hypothetical protein